MLKQYNPYFSQDDSLIINELLYKIKEKTCRKPIESIDSEVTNLMEIAETYFEIFLSAMDNLTRGLNLIYSNLFIDFILSKIILLCEGDNGYLSNSKNYLVKQLNKYRHPTFRMNDIPKSNIDGNYENVLQNYKQEFTDDGITYSEYHQLYWNDISFNDNIKLVNDE